MTMAENSKVKTSVWWDIENCEVPKGWDAHGIGQNVGSALLNMNYCGPVSILAYGDTNLIPHHVQQALSSTGVGLNHVPAGVKDASDKKILVDMLLWAVDNPAPANIMLISGDRDFSNALHQLSMRRYTILLAQPPHASAPLVAAAKNVWLWTSLASGGPPITSGESSQQLNSGLCSASNPVSEPTGSSSVAGDSKDHKTRDNHVPRGATGETVTSSSDSFRAHLSDKRHTSQDVSVASHKAHASVTAKPIHEADVVEPVLCTVCQISCISKETYANHIYGKKHRNNLELQSGKVENVSGGPVPLPKEVMERQSRRTRRRQRKVLTEAQEPVALPKEVLTRQDRRTRRRQRKVLIDSMKPQEKGVGEKSKPREAIAEPQFQFQDSQEKHVAMVNQEVEEKGEGEKSQPVETITEPQNTQEETKCLEKQSKELREILLGSSKHSPRSKDQAETVNKQLLNDESRECFDGIFKPVNQSKGATDNHSTERQAVRVRCKLCPRCVVICDSQGVSTLVHWTTNQKHTKAAFVSSDDAERLKKVLWKDQTAFDSLKHADMVKKQTKKALLDTEKQREALEQEDKEEVKEINAISENLVHAFNGPNRIHKESRGCLDVITEGVQVPPPDETKHKLERGNECKELPREADKREESKKVQVDNLLTRLWWGKS